MRDERGEGMKRILSVIVALAPIVAIAPLTAKDNEPAQRLDAAAVVFSEVMGAPDKGIPQEMLEHAHCIVIVPELKKAAVSSSNAIFSAMDFGIITS